jgi:Flp pilus assembly protein TadG
MIRKEATESGQSFTEIAISLVFILILLASIVDLGRIFFTFVALRDAAQEGAAYASICPTDTAGVETRVRTSSNLPVNLLDTSDILVEVFQDYVDIEVTVRVTHQDFSLSMPFLGGVTVPLRAVVTDSILTFTLTCPP